jgi:hypothetical protein
MTRSSKEGIRRAIFGYRPGAVEQLLAERDAMQRAAEGVVLAAEARVAELERDIEQIRAGIDLRDAQVRQMESELAALERTATEEAPKLLSREVDSILSAAQETASRIVARARAVSQREAEQAGDDLHTHVARLVAWREEALPLMREVEANLRELRESVEGFGRRLAAALGPLERIPVDDLAESIAAVGPAVEAAPSMSDRIEVRESVPGGEELRITESGPAEQRPAGRVSPSASSNGSKSSNESNGSNGSGRSRRRNGSNGSGGRDAAGDGASDAIPAGSTS